MDRVSTSLRCIVENILSGKISNQAELEASKKAASSELGLSSLPSNADILALASSAERESLGMLVLKPTRTLSGVAVIAVMTSPARCPHGICIPCPGGPGCEESSPQSYTGQEPAAMRAFQHHFDPYQQVKARLIQLQEIGHLLDKVELIIMGGTFTSREIGYQHWFIKRCLQAMNDYPFKKIGADHASSWISFREVALANQSAAVRNVGTTFETRPDWCRSSHVQWMLNLGATKVELGVQSTLDHVLESIRRGHRVKDTILANKILRNAGLKVGFHMMPGLPGSSLAADLSVFRELFDNTRFRPDYLKIYPTLVIAGTELHQMYQRGEYRPLENEEAAELISRIKELLPGYVRLQRVQRDIPARLIVAGVKKSNLRQMACKKMEDRGAECSCIRCREAGLRGVFEGAIDLKCVTYEACGGQEYFLSYEDEEDTLVGFLRLRLGKAARIRELHIYGPMVPIGTKKDGWQHRGYGAKLLVAAEDIAAEAGYRTLEITSGLGVRNYYQRLGYELREPYMIKNFKGGS